MREYKRKEKLACMLLLFLMASACMTGCSKVIDHTENASYEITKLKNGYLLKGCDKITVRNGMIYAADNYLEESRTKGRLISYQLDGYEIKAESLEVLLDDSIIDFVVSENNDIYALGLRGQKYIFYIRSADGEKLYEEFPIEYRNDSRAIFYIQVDKEGRYYFGASNGLHIMDSDFNELANLQEPVEGLVTLKNGRVAYLTSADSGYSMKEIDDETFQPSREQKIKLAGNFTGNFKSGIDYDFNYESENCLYGYDFENGKAHLLFRLKKEAKTAASQIFPFGEQQYIMDTYSDEGDKVTVVVNIKDNK